MRYLVWLCLFLLISCVDVPNKVEHDINDREFNIVFDSFSNFCEVTIRNDILYIRTQQHSDSGSRVIDWAIYDPIADYALVNQWSPLFLMQESITYNPSAFQLSIINE